MHSTGFFNYIKLNRSGNFTGTQAARANVNGLRGAVYDSLNSSDIGLPGSVGLAVGMGYCKSELYCFSADAALCHDIYLRI